MLRALQEHADAHTVVLLGDVLDMYSASRFSRSRHVDPLEEIEKAAVLLDFIARNFPRVVVLEGNHDSRPVRWIRNTRPELSGLLLHPYEYLRYVYGDGGLVRRYENVVFPRAVMRTGEHEVGSGSFFVEGDALFSHLERSLKNPGRTAMALVQEWLPQWESMLGRKIRVFIQAHVHRLAKMQWGRYTIVECGSMTRPHQYMLDDPRYHPPYVGYVTLVQRDGVTDINSVNYTVIEGGYRIEVVG